MSRASFLLAALLLAALAATTATVSLNGLPGCQTRCGDVDIPYPFGFGDNFSTSGAKCSLPGFEIACVQNGSGGLMPVLGGTQPQIQVLNLSATPRPEARVMLPVSYRCYNSRGYDNGSMFYGSVAVDPAGVYRISSSLNELFVLGCNTSIHTTILDSGGRYTGCVARISNHSRSAQDGVCSGVGCCYMNIPTGLTDNWLQFGSWSWWYDPHADSMVFDPRTSEFCPCDYAFIVEKGSYTFRASDLTSMPLNQTMPLRFDWAIRDINGSAMSLSCANAPKDPGVYSCVSAHSECVNSTNGPGYFCSCTKGYEGNPYLVDGCTDIDECALPDKCFGECTNTPGGSECRCPRGARGNPHIRDGCVKSSLGLSVGIGVGSGAGLLFLVLGASFVTRKVKHRRAKKLKQKFFKQNRGHLLQQLVSQRADIAERMIVPLEELEKATNNFDKARELGGGGHGTVYKGILSDLHVVAIKKSNVAIQREIDEFINEVAILSQINHRNVVKLFGCCLETEVPLLVYEFISNGTLYQHLHVEGPISLSWEDRLRIATETARALAYLHSAVSFPIIHRDVKSRNILLDGTLTTKVSDFGASRCVPVDQTGVTTVVQGTHGYLDPMCYYTGRLTEKSDVYSFGVILIELLTRKKPFSYRSSEGVSLVAHFTSLIAEGSLVHVLDPQVIEKGGRELEELAALAAVCVKLEAEERPTTRQVEMTLESLGASQEHAALHNIVARRSAETHVAVTYPTTEGGGKESSRQYSLEEEYLLSARYPR